MKTKEFFDSVAKEWDSHELSTQEELKAFLLSCGVEGGKRTLDLGCGTGIISGILQELGCTVCALDLSEEMIRLAEKKHEGKGIRFYCGDFYSFEEEPFEQVVIFNAYPHFMDQAAFEKKLSSLLQPKGTFIIAHNIGRDKLVYHHRHVTDISRSLLPAEEEARLFSAFEISEAYDSDSRYLIRGRKK